MTFNYKCINKECPNHSEFEVEAQQTHCQKCGCKVNRAYKSIGVSLSFPGSFNSTRKR